MNYFAENEGFNTAKCLDNQCNRFNLYIKSGGPNRIRDYVDLGFVLSEEQRFSISPRPLYLPIGENNACPNGYVPNADNSFCIRDDISDLTCFVLGCPNINGTQYQCTSAGICAETVYISQSCKYDSETYNLLNDSEKLKVNQNEICPSGTTCDVSTGFCIKSEIYNDLIQCKTVADCPMPCQGKTTVCNELDRCAYSGECVKQTYGCEDVGCEEGYTCQENNTCKENKMPSIFSNPIFLTFGGMLVIVILIWILIKRFRRRR